MGGMRVLRVSTGTVHSRSKVRRGLEHLAITPLYAWRALGIEKVDAVYTISPPLTMGIAAWLAAKWHGTQYCLGVQDLFPQQCGLQGGGEQTDQARASICKYLN